MKTGLSLLIIALLVAPGCNKIPTPPTTVTPTPYSDSQIFVGTLSAQGSAFQAINVQTSATVTVLLASLTLTGTTTNVSAPLKLAVGTLSTTSDGSSCTSTNSVTATPALTTQLTQSLITGTYCVLIADSGGLASDVDFAIRINQSANTSALGQAGTETFSSNLYPLGVATRTFAVSQSGNVTVTLSNVTPVARVGFGVGIPFNNDCILNTSVLTTPGSGAELSTNADAGTYCVRMFDTGQLPGRVLFNVKIVHP